jgi:polyisoprenoid-binding protein YceI
MGGAAIEGEFKRFRGTFQLDGKDVARSKVDISIDSGSVSAADPRIEEFIKSESVFDSANHPTVRFVSTGATRSGDRTAAIEGRLSAKGITRPTRFSVTLQEQTAGTLKFRVTGKLSRALFKMDVGTPIYSNIVVLDMTLIGHRN